MAKRPTANLDDNDGKKVRGIDPLIQSLLQHLPRSGEVWPPPQRKDWVTMLENAFKVIYKDAPDPPKEKSGGAVNPRGAV